MDEERRRATPSYELIVYQLGEVKSVVEKGFQRLEDKVDGLAERTASLERFKERVEERERAMAQQADSSKSDLIRALLGLIAIVGAVVYFVVQGGHL